MKNCTTNIRTCVETDRLVSQRLQCGSTDLLELHVSTALLVFWSLQSWLVDSTDSTRLDSSTTQPRLAWDSLPWPSKSKNEGFTLERMRQAKLQQIWELGETYQSDLALCWSSLCNLSNFLRMGPQPGHIGIPITLRLFVAHASIYASMEVDCKVEPSPLTRSRNDFVFLAGNDIYCHKLRLFSDSSRP
jgi:hypothetical protein